MVVSLAEDELRLMARRIGRVEEETPYPSSADDALRSPLKRQALSAPCAVPREEVGPELRTRCERRWPALKVEILVLPILPG